MDNIRRGNILKEIKNANRFDDDVYLLVEDDLTFGLEKDQIDLYLKKNFKLSQMKVLSSYLRKGIDVEFVELVANHPELTGYQVQVALDFFQKGVPIATIEGKGQDSSEKSEIEMPEFSVSVTPYEKEGSSVRGLARIYFDDSFIVNNVSILQGKDKLFVAMPAYKTKQVDEQGKAIYQDVCYPVTKEFREKLYSQIINEYDKAKEQTQTQAQERASQVPERAPEKEATPFR